MEAAALASAGLDLSRRDAPGLRLIAGSPGPAADVLAALGHELRAPLASLRATLELLVEQPDSPADAAALIARLEGSLGWLEGVVDNLATWALVETGRLPLARRRVDAAAVASRALALVAPLLERRGQPARLLAPDPGPAVLADPQHLGQVLVNLLTNASRHGPPGAPIELQVAAGPEAVELRVTDRGPGVPRREQSHIWGRYARGARAGAGGLGLGLHIVRSLVALHGGAVGLDSPPGQGASFWVRLPTAPELSLTQTTPCPQEKTP